MFLCSSRIEQLHYDAGSGELLVLNSGLHLGERVRSIISAIDLQTRAETARCKQIACPGG